MLRLRQPQSRWRIERRSVLVILAQILVVKFVYRPLLERPLFSLSARLYRSLGIQSVRTRFFESRLASPNRTAWRKRIPRCFGAAVSARLQRPLTLEQLESRLVPSVSVTAATGGTSISADKAANASSPQY